MAGIYYLAISLSGAEPVNFANQLLFLTAPSTALRGPNPNATGPLVDWDTSLVGVQPFGDYQIDLTGAETVLEPSTVALLGIGILVAAFVAWKRRRATLGSLKAASFKIFAQTARSSFFAIGAISLVAALSAKPVPDNLGYGLDKLVESNLLLRAGAGRNVGRFDGYATAQAASYAATAIMDGKDRVLVDITLTGRVPFATLRTSLERTVRSLTITSVDARYRGVGVIEGYVSVDQASALARTRGVSAVFLVQKPFLDGAVSTSAPSGPNSPPTLLGTTFDQGVTQHRVDKINQFYNPASL